MILSLPAPAAIARVLKESFKTPRLPRGERDSSLSVASAIHAGLYSVLMKNVRLVSWRSSLSVPGRRSRCARSRLVSSRGLPVISAESISISRNFVSIRNVQFLREPSRDALLALSRGVRLSFRPESGKKVPRATRSSQSRESRREII